MSSSMDYCLSTEINQIVDLQGRDTYLGPFLEKLSIYMSPTMIMTVWIPLIGAFDAELLIDVMLLVSTAMFGSSLIKWMVPEPRPFWWINENKFYTPKNKPPIKVFPVTCETTSGSFSSHSIIFTVFLLVLGMKLVDIFRDGFGCQRKWLKYTVYATAMVASILMWMSRMYLATHFLHQCIAGSILAAAIVYYYYENYEFQENVAGTAQKDALLFAVVCSALATLMYGAMLLFGVDVQWSVRLAFKWCTSPDYLNPDTTPVYGIVKNLALIFGVATAAPLTDKKEQRLNLFLSTPAALIIVLVNQALELVTPTKFGRLAFLAYAFIRHYVFAYVVAHFIPKYCAAKCDED